MAEAAPVSSPYARASNLLVSLISRIRASIETCADYYAAAAIYEQLATLSDAELTRRGLSRATLARDVCAACDRRAFDL
jgi:hypothetical protein